MTDKQLALLNGINTKSGLALCKYNIPLYTKLLLLFLQSEYNFQVQFTNNMLHNDYQQMYKQLHSLKSASAIIGAEALQTASLNLELICAQNKMNKDLATILIRELNIVLEGIKKFKDSIENRS